MKYNSVIELKHELIAITLRRAGIARQMVANATLKSRRIQPSRAGAPAQIRSTFGLALGATQEPGSRDWLLAVRVQEADLLHSPILEEIKKQARGEVEIRYTGAVRSLRYRPPAHPPGWQQTRRRHLEIGISVGHKDITAGTLGCFVLKKGRRGWFILSNNHVLAQVNAGVINDAILQPGPLDGGNLPADHIASLADYVPISFAEANLMDAAIAEIADGIEIVPDRIHGIGQIGALRHAPVEIGMKVRKMGRTTALTTGLVTAVAMDDVDIFMGAGNAFFDNQIEIESATGRHPFSLGGDSGSLIVDAERQPSALLFAGSETGGKGNQGLTYANPLPEVMERLGISFGL